MGRRYYYPARREPGLQPGQSAAAGAGREAERPLPLLIDEVEADLSGEGDPGVVGRPDRDRRVLLDVGQSARAGSVRLDRPDLPGNAVRLGDRRAKRSLIVRLARRLRRSGGRTAKRAEGDPPAVVCEMGSAYVRVLLTGQNVSRP